MLQPIAHHRSDIRRRDHAGSLYIRLIALVLILASTHTMAAKPVYRELKDWVVACDNTGDCEARGGFTDAGETPLLMRLTRAAGPSGTIALSLELGQETSAFTELPAMHLDGKPIASGTKMWRIGDETGFYETNSLANIQRFVDEVRNGTHLSIVHKQVDYSASLDGLTAALLLVDEAQGRPGNRTALIQRGSKPPSQVPARSKPPMLRGTSRVPQTLREEEADRLIADVRRTQADTLAKEDCFVEAQDSHDQAHALTEDEALVMIECWRGAYQASSLLFRSSRNGPPNVKRLILPLPLTVDEGSDQHHEISAFTSVDYNSQDGGLQHVAKGRGLGDCGEMAHWLFNGREFQLGTYQYLGSCRGGDSYDWPSLWKTN